MQLLNTIQVIQQLAKYVVQQSRSNLSKKKKNLNKSLYNSIEYQVTDKRKSVDVAFKMLDYGKFVDRGVRGRNAYYADQDTSSSPYKYKDRMPPIEELSVWAKQRRIRLRNDKGQFARGNYKTIGFLIARSIYDKGIKASMFFTKPYRASLKKYEKPMLEAIGMDVYESLIKHQNKTKI